VESIIAVQDKRRREVKFLLLLSILPALSAGVLAGLLPPPTHLEIGNWLHAAEADTHQISLNAPDEDYGRF
jgi:hypothetical protein